MIFLPVIFKSKGYGYLNFSIIKKFYILDISFLVMVILNFASTTSSRSLSFSGSSKFNFIKFQFFKLFYSFCLLCLSLLFLKVLFFSSSFSYSFFFHILFCIGGIMLPPFRLCFFFSFNPFHSFSS